MTLLRSRPMRQRSDRQARRERDLSRVKVDLLRLYSWRCYLCQDRESALEAHHPFGRHELSERWFADVDTLIPLCPSCHARCTNPADEESHRLAAACRQECAQRLTARYERVTGNRGAAGVVAGWTTTRAAIWLTEAIEKVES